MVIEVMSFHRFADQILWLSAPELGIRVLRLCPPNSCAVPLPFAVRQLKHFGFPPRKISIYFGKNDTEPDIIYRKYRFWNAIICNCLEFRARIYRHSGDVKIRQSRTRAKRGWIILLTWIPLARKRVFWVPCVRASSSSLSSLYIYCNSWCHQASQIISPEKLTKGISASCIYSQAHRTDHFRVWLAIFELGISLPKRGALVHTHGQMLLAPRYRAYMQSTDCCMQSADGRGVTRLCVCRDSLTSVPWLIKLSHYRTIGNITRLHKQKAKKKKRKKQRKEGKKVYTYTYIYVDVYMFVCLFACMHICTYVCKHNSFSCFHVCI